MYERSMKQMQEREQKLKALQQIMYEDCTFTPKSNDSSRRSPKEASPSGAVFDRLYSTETAAMRAHKSSPRSNASTLSSSTPTNQARRKSLDNQATPSRIEALYESAKKKKIMSTKVCVSARKVLLRMEFV